MEVDDIQPQGLKFPRIGNNNGSRSNFNKSLDDEEAKRSDLGLAAGGLAGGIAGGRLCGWPSSRIVRVSRASGGKDRHSKVLTSKGLRDRRVRLSVGTAIQFYDLQDRLGYDQPSKAVEWLLKAASKSIDELPSITTPFPEETLKIAPLLGTDQEQRFDSGDLNHNNHHNGHNGSLSKSGCSSTSETSKGSSLSLSRSESRIKARERAKERMADKDKSFIPISQSSFTELLTGGLNNVNRGTNCGQNLQNGSSSAQRNILGFPAMDYSSGFSGHHPSGFSGHSPMTISHYNASAGAGDPHQELQFSFVQDHNFPVATAAVHGGAGGGDGGGDYNLNFTISSGLAGLNRGTLQSNSQSFSMPQQHVQRLSSSIDGSNVPFFIGTSSPNGAPVENHHHHSQFPAGLQLYYGDGGRNSDQKGKGKN